VVVQGCEVARSRDRAVQAEVARHCVLLPVVLPD
jgi:hypothetical protein